MTDTIAPINENEPITIEDNSRFCLFPIKYNDLYNAYETHRNCFWTAQEVDFVKDKEQYKLLTENEQRFIESILAFFANSDGIVLENLFTNLTTKISVPEARQFYAMQTLSEAIHQETYSKLIDTFISCPKRKQELFTAIDTIPVVKKKSQWALDKIHQKKDHCDLSRLLFSFGIVEGLFFSSSFASIFWLKERNLLVHSLGLSNQWISRDESFHTDFAALLHTYVKNKISEEEAIEIMKDAVKIEIEFITESIKCDMIGMKKKEMATYICYVADRLMVSFGYNVIYEASNPYPFISKVSLDGKTNFFEAKVTEYALPSQVSSETNFDVNFDTEF